MSESERLLVIDIGNTSVTAGLYCNGRVTHVHRVAETTNRKLAKSDILDQLAERYRFVDCLICSVVPSLNAPWSKTAKKWIGRTPTILSHKTPMPIGLQVPKPETIGADRLANACGAIVRYSAPCIVIDIGTALTFDVVNADGAYVGGVIAPGMSVMFNYMAEKTALLPRIEPQELYRSIGETTEEAMRIGGQVGCRGMVREILKEVERELNADNVQIVATGGYAKWIMPELDAKIPVDDDITLFGLGAVYDYQVGT